MKKIAVVVDRHDSALGTSAKNRAIADSRIQVIAAMDFPTPKAFLSSLHANDFELILFTWRFVAWELMVCNQWFRKHESLEEFPKIAILIPDHLGLTAQLQKREQDLISAVDYILVTNNKLAEHYSKAYPLKFRGILHDLPDDVLITSFRHGSIGYKERVGITWIGNSRWGRNLKIRDHKGLYQVILPVMLTLEGVPFQIFDSANGVVPHDLVLSHLSKSRYLLQASKSEGTGLPLLEAMGTGAIPISTNVGIAEEVLPEDLQFLIVDRDPTEFLKCYEQLERSNLELISRRLRDAYDEYVARAKRERILFSAARGSRKVDASWYTRLVIKIKWAYRNIRFKQK